MSGLIKGPNIGTSQTENYYRVVDFEKFYCAGTVSVSDWQVAGQHVTEGVLYFASGLSQSDAEAKVREITTAIGVSWKPSS